MRLRVAPVVVGLLVASASCSSFKQVADDAAAGDGAAQDRGTADVPPLTSCTGTSVRSFQPLGQSTASSVQAAIGWAGEAPFNIWEQVLSKTSGKIYWARLDQLGKVYGARQLADGRDPVLVQAAGEQYLFWREQQALVMGRLDAAGALTDKQTLHAPLTSSFDVAFDGQSFGIALNGIDAAGDVVHFMRANAAGEVLTPPQRLPQQGINATQAVVRWTGTSFALAWTDMRQGTPAIYFALLDKEGQRKSDDQMVSAAGIRGSFPTLAAQSLGGLLLCYQQRMTETNQEIYCSRLDAAGNVTRTTRLTQNAYDSLNPHAVAHGRITWVVWDDHADGAIAPTIHWQFLDESGAPVLAQPKNSALDGWRAHPAARPEALYSVQYTFDGNAWVATSSIINCF